MKSHVINRGASLILIKQIRKITSSKETKKKLLRQKETFSIMKLETLKAKGLNQELNKETGQTYALPS